MASRFNLLRPWKYGYHPLVPYIWQHKHPPLPPWQKGDPQRRILFPLYTMKMLRPEISMPKNQVLFECNMQMNEHDVKNYLEQIYDVPVHHVRLTLNKGEQRLHPMTGNDYGRHPDFKLAYVTLANGVTFEFPQVVQEEGEGEIDKDVKDQERAEKYTEYLKQQNWKKKYGGPDWFC